MSSDGVLILLLFFLLFFIFAFIFKKWLREFSEKGNPSQELLSWLKSTNERLDDQNKHIVATLQSSTKALNERLDNAAGFIASVQKNIGEMSEIGRGMKEVQEFLQSPKLRGNIGEHILAELLSQMLPKQLFHLQYTFKSGARVDAAVKTENGIIPIDSKIPLENFRKLITAKDEAEKKTVLREFVIDVKKHVDDISKKYILTEEGTIDYALMYIPSEAVYYEVVNNPQLFEYATGKRVLPVSPMTFYAYLKAILMSFEGQKIEKQAHQILKIIQALRKDYLKTEDNLSVLSRHVTNAYNQMSTVLTSFTLLGQKLSATSSLSEEKNEVKETKKIGDKL